MNFNNKTVTNWFGEVFLNRNPLILKFHETKHFIQKYLIQYIYRVYNEYNICLVVT